MNLVVPAIRMIERLPCPDVVTRRGIAALVGRRRRAIAALNGNVNARFAVAMADHPIAEDAASANAQHYELPPEFFALFLGPQRKYSCCLYDEAVSTGGQAAPAPITLAQAEERALAATAAHAGLGDGQRILELGCGWGALTLWMARRYPAARITGVSNSHAQRAFIMRRAAERGLGNVDVVTADMNSFCPDDLFDRVVSVEMFEHMSNWGALLRRIRIWMVPQGRLFIHVFSHRSAPYRFDHRDSINWIAQHFFTGGVMPSHGLIREFHRTFAVEAEWRWNGRHYERTARDWLARFDAHGAHVRAVLKAVHGRDAGLWHRRWRLFLLATAGLFGHRHGEEWGVSHFRLAPA
jgi:cyclopropane-fatty-acyl-phospholipid synthase